MDNNNQLKIKIVNRTHIEYKRKYYRVTKNQISMRSCMWDLIRQPKYGLMETSQYAGAT